MPMLGRSWTLFRVFGFPIKINPTWFLLFLLIVFSLSSRDGLFHRWLEGQEAPAAAVWLLGVAGAIGLFACLLIHELSHSVVARCTGMPVRGITLFIFGGVSEMEDEPPTAAAELAMAVAGPLASLALSALFWSLWALFRFVLTLSPLLQVILLYLAIVNLALAVFNSLPAFPLDGGRVLRSVLWGVTDNLWTSTRIAATVGSGFGILMIVAGIFSLFYGGGIGGLWLIFLGFFLRQAASSSMQNVMMRRTLNGERVARFMTTPPVCVARNLPVDRFVDEYVLPYHFSLFPVIDGEGRMLGVVHSLEPGRIDRSRWPDTPVGDIMRPRTPEQTISPHTPALHALARLGSQRGNRLTVVENNRPVGIISLRDLMDFIGLKADLQPGSCA